jgi:DNA-binding NtrC family response regulator
LTVDADLAALRRYTDDVRAGGLALVSMMSTRVLLVEPDVAVRERLRNAAGRVSHIDGDAAFPVARTHLLSNPYDWVVTNIRLAAYNGLHLVHLAAAAGLPARFVVYADPRDLALAREAQRAGAFYETRDRVDRALAAFLRGSLPPQDRRNAEVRDRRRFMFRGGSRSTDGMGPEVASTN